EFGEGTRSCLQREFMEEMNLRVDVAEHIYTTDYFQMSAFNPEHQIVSVYYMTNPLEEIKVPLRNKPFDFDERQLKVYEATRETETFRFVDWQHFSADSMTLPIDKIVADLVKATY
ncbi:MAG: NUDIX hydrolase, partial [Chitinophagaceae bacterium]|nr:NUDIX hydrolase [Chitinophagaceae bacterium]